MFIVGEVRIQAVNPTAVRMCPTVLRIAVKTEQHEGWQQRVVRLEGSSTRPTDEEVDLGYTSSGN